MNKMLFTHRPHVLLSCAALLAAQLAAMGQAALNHRYSFFSYTNGTPVATDVVAGADGTLFGDATIQNGQLQLDGNAYVTLPAGIITNSQAVTVEAWGDYPDLSEQGLWGNLFDFGTQNANNQDSYSISFCVNVNGSQDLDAAISDFDNANMTRENCYAAANLLPNTVGSYIAAVFDPPHGYIAIYFNGSLQNKIPITSTITPGVRDANNEIGWDNWNDAKMVGNLDEFRIWAGALNGLEVAASYQSGDALLNTNAGTITSLTVTAGAQVVEGGQEPATVLATASGITNTVDVTVLATYASANSNILTIDALGGIHGKAPGTSQVEAFYGGQSNSVAVTVVEPISTLAHRYSFSDPAGGIVLDSVGTLNGSLMGSAVESNGTVVLDGTAGSYVDLSSNSFANDGIISGFQSATVDYWATFGTLQNWTYAWAFGNSTGAGANYAHSVVRDGNSQHEIDNFTTAGGAGFAALGDFANEAVHCTTVMDVPTGHLAIYTNGVLSGYVTNDFAPLSSIATNFIYIGRSLWTAVGPFGTGDPYVPAAFDEIRVYNGTLTPQQIALADQLGPNNTNVTVGALQGITVSIPAMQLGDIIIGPVLANYGNLNNYNVTGNSLTPLFVFTSSNSNVVFQATDGKLHAVGEGKATVTATYQGFISSQVVTVVHNPVLVNRYSFHDAPGSATAADSVGGWTGALPGGGTFTGTELDLSASVPQFVQLPSGILSNYPAVTIDMWCSFPDPAPVNCMLYGFGNTDTNTALPWLGENYIFCAPVGGRIAISGVDPGFAGEQGVAGAGNFTATNSIIHLTSVYDPPGGTESLYTNGVLVGINRGVTVPMSFVYDETNYIGHSLYTGDPHEDLNLNEFRIYNGALSPVEVAASEALGPSALLSNARTSLAVTQSGGNLVISWPAAAAAFSLYSSPTLGANANWTLSSATPVLVGQTFQVTVPTSGPTLFYELRH
ncbi:MAG TPA: LamG-like jellyroll fold domain-containing protein [Verrucomicrobiae bacterium]|jgi:hypothetical protein